MMLSYEAIQAFLYAEARALDEKRWADWLACYADDVEFFMPSWDDDDKLTTDPHNEVSLIYYPSKQGLEDRVFRIETDRSSATTPDTRTGHAITQHRGAGAGREARATCPSTGRRTASATTSSTSTSARSQYTIDTSGDEAADQAQVRRAEERLHPPHARRLSHLDGQRRAIARRQSMAYNIALQFEDGVIAHHPVRAERTGRRRRLPRQDQHPARLPRRRLRHLQVPLRERQLHDGRLHRGRPGRRRGRQRLRAHLPDAADVGLRGRACRRRRPRARPKSARTAASSTKIERDSATTVSFSLQAEQPLAFLPGQYVNLQVPGSKETRSYSFSSRAEQQPSCRS